ncbi:MULTISPECIES: glycosyltransferase 87 family protein [Arthrobacter]|uniref:Glycosyltransferase 87 family protein n=2 Tax=Arthrobacter TaxID=1663 RepID=A0ABU9KGG3_9MICC|nr:glycosyltransferase 87 family protein [Arthrobacter sp. YJM1]MDP5225631.1 glycosyltransferase 87 family protein [Arthrobacter sp. YJM1]
MSRGTMLDRLTALRDRLLPTPLLTWFGTRGSVWWGFAVVHLYFLGWMASFFLSGQTFSDTEQYRQWATGVVPDRPGMVPITPWVYPALAQLPIRLANLLGAPLYLLGWFLIITALNAWALAVLTSGPRKRSGVAPAWWWMFFLVFIGYLSFARVEGVVAPLVLVGLLAAARRPVVATALLSVATWMKVWPAAVIAPVLIASRDRLKVLATGIAVTAAVVIGTWATGNLSHLADFLTQQGERGMQLEATFSTPWVWLSVFGIAGSRIADNVAINSSEVYGPGAPVAAWLMQPLFLLVVLAGAGLLLWALRKGAEREELFLEGALLMTAAFIVFNKVGSPQFMVWLAPVVIAGLNHDWERWKVPGALLMVIAMTTFVIYPLFYTPLIHANPIMAGVLTLRNVLLVVLLVWSVRRTLDLGRSAASRAADAPVPAG